MKNLNKIIATVAIVVGLVFAVKAQPGSGAGFGDEPVDAPIDGGIILLAAAGAAYGYKKLRK